MVMKFREIRLLPAGFLRYALVGLANTAAGMSISLLLLNAARCSYWTATAAGTAAGVALSYALNRRLTFRSRAPVAATLPRFLLVAAGCYAAAYGSGLALGPLLARFLDASGGFSLSALPSRLASNAEVLVGSAVYAALGYAGHRHWTFRPAGRRLPERP
jgi:putative flippase GtrA